MSKKYFINPKATDQKYEVQKGKTFAETATRIVIDNNYTQLKQLLSGLQGERAGLTDYDLLINLGWIYVDEPELNDEYTENTEYSKIACECREINPEDIINNIMKQLVEGCNIFTKNHDKTIIISLDNAKKMIEALISGANAIDAKSQNQITTDVEEMER